MVNKCELKPVKQVALKKKMSADELVRCFGASGVMGAGRVARAADVLEKMVSDKDCVKFFGLAGAMVPGGMREVVADMLRSGWIDVFVSTGANLTHDLFEAMGFKHMQGTAQCSDEELNKRGIDRIYESYLDNDVYVKLEKFIDKIYPEISQKTTIKEFLWAIGSKVEDKNSLLRICYEKKIPIFCPGIADSGIGLMVWGQLGRKRKCEVRAFDDLTEIMDVAWNCKRAGVFYVGGGVPKNFIQQAMQIAPKAAEYGIQITMDRPEPGGSSGAELREGISWGKMAPEAKFVDVICDATIALPLIVAAVKERV